MANVVKKSKKGQLFKKGDFVKVKIGGSKKSRNNIWLVLGYENRIVGGVYAVKLMLVKGEIVDTDHKKGNKNVILGPGYEKSIRETSLRRIFVRIDDLNDLSDSCCESSKDRVGLGVDLLVSMGN